jgi:hypothetical protein
MHTLKELTDAIKWLVRRMSTSSGETIDTAYFCGAIDMLSQTHGVSVSVIRAAYIDLGGRQV